ncbi:MAG: dihydroorotase [Cytophagaceae bacterium]|nr:dihydroorotase [Cytophagaceae bacterium]
MNILIKSAEIIDPNSDFHKKTKNILIENGVIKKISDSNHKADRTIEGKNLKASPGWFDMRVSIKDPGSEHKEDINTVAQAAAAGGVTEIACLPNTKPVIQSKDVISYIKSKAQSTTLNIYPIAAVTLEAKGEELTEMIDLHHAGAIAFSDGSKPIWHSDILLKALQYIQMFDGLIIDRPEERQLSNFGQMNEGKMSTLLGLKGIPKLAEELIIERDLKILEYTGGRIHFSLISSPGSLDLIREAKKKGLNVTCDIAAHHLCLDDSLLENFDTNYKVNPPLRSKEDINQFWKALADNTIDVIVSDHNPQDEESKNLEFDLADFGILGLQTLFPVINTYNKKIKLEKIIEKLTVTPREILNIPIPKIEEGAKANITIFDPETEWVFSEKDIKSKSKNSPFIGKKLKGTVVAVFNNNQHFIH